MFKIYRLLNSGMDWLWEHTRFLPVLPLTTIILLSLWVPGFLLLVPWFLVATVGWYLAVRRWVERK